MAENFSQALQSSMNLAREFVSYLNPENDRPAITNWPTQLLGNRPVSGSIVYRLSPKGKAQTVTIESFTPARDLKTGKHEKGAVRQFRLAYEAGLPADAAKPEFWNLLACFVISAITGELPSPNRASGESTLKGTVAHTWIKDFGIILDSVVATNPETGVSLERSGESTLGVLMAFAENYQRIVSQWTPKANQRAKASGGLDWSVLD